MSIPQISLGWAALGGLAIAAVSGIIGFELGQSDPPSSAAIAQADGKVVEEPRTPPASAPEPDPLAVSDAEIDALLAEMEEETPAPPEFDPEEMQARQERWENMSIEQRRMLRRSMFSALAKVEGLEEVGDAIRQGKIDPRQFNLNPEAIADRMEFYADSMDQTAMEEEVTKTLQNVVDQARKQLGN